MVKVVSIGEILIRFQAPNHSRLSQTPHFDAYYGGAEANVAVGLSHLGHDLTLLSSLPKDHPLGDRAVQHLRKHSVSDRLILRDGERIGIYYVEQGFSNRPGKLVYDRQHSSILALVDRSIDWDDVYLEQDWLHLSGVTPAIDPKMRDFVVHAVKEANARGVKVSFDFNFRSKLWSKEEAVETFKTLLPYVDHCFAGWKDFVLLFDWEPKGDTMLEQLQLFYKRLQKEYDISSASCTNRHVINSSRHELTAYHFDGGILHEGKTVKFDVLDRIGGGDSFAAGVLHGIFSDMKPAELLDFSTALSALNHFVLGDNSGFSEEEVFDYIQNQSGDVSR
ncbi:2-dehydro-3-deoxygluconokinase [Salipaludibacillus neizhouensis]|uniref:2-dehydro-3-deoxygluconokinase n=1 Tax=Salipaludibacillus neizhouensis TaxID=885475 RepID=A0A3A9KKZ7_9BACI|nr:sugar kinase [Salipaludibacillus neizhouensis]RKL65546.1 2-dehydro-3-deoxygluconokinase [Salipaludibacillus neizhouensis]